MIQSINPLKIYSDQYSVPSSQKRSSISLEPPFVYENEDTAIISAEAKMLDELDRYNSGESNELKLVMTSNEAKYQVMANSRVIKVQKEITDSVMDMYA